MSHPRDPRQRRQRDAAAGAVRLEVATESWRAAQRDTGPEPEILAAADSYREQLDAMLDEVSEFPAPAPGPPVAPALPAPAEPSVSITERGRVLDWSSRHDPRSLQFGVRPRLAGSAPVQDVELPTGPVFDQGTEGACFGMAAAAAVNSMRLAGLLDPGAPLLTADDALALYHLAQLRDEQPGESYDGTSVTGGMRAVREKGLSGGYLWSFGTRDIAQTIVQRRGAVIVGVPWLSGMFDTGPGGLVELRGDNRGLGHCLAVVGIRRTGPQGQPGPHFRWQCSYGTGYGDGGFGWIHHRDLATLLHGFGEAAIPTREAQS